MSIDKTEKPDIKKKKGSSLRKGQKTDINRPDISRLLTPEGIKNPLADVDYGDGDIENTDLREVAEDEEGAILKALKASEKADKKRFQVAVDSGFWFCLYFQSRAQKEAFLTAMGWLLHGDKYLNGLQIADQQGIMLPDEVLQAKVRSAGRLTDLAEDLGQIKIKRR